MTATIALPAGRIACSGCGRAVPAGPRSELATETVVTAWHPSPKVEQPLRSDQLGRCAACAALDVHARTLLGPDGDESAQVRLGRVLACFRVIGRPLPDPARHSVAEIMRWFGRFDPTWTTALFRRQVRERTAAAEPWSHVDAEFRAVLVAQFGYWQHARAFPDRPVRVRAPGGACLFCGLAYVEVSARHAHDIAPAALWHRCTADPVSLGGRGAQRLNGALCADCAAAATDSDDRLVIGPTALETALARWWESHGERNAARWVRFGEYAVVGWAVTGREPNRVPWDHVQVPELAETVRGAP